MQQRNREDGACSVCLRVEPTGRAAAAAALRARIAQAWRANPDLLPSEIAQRFGVSVAAATRARQRARGAA